MNRLLLSEVAGSEIKVREDSKKYPEGALKALGENGLMLTERIDL